MWLPDWWPPTGGEACRSECFASPSWLEWNLDLLLSSEAAVHASAWNYLVHEVQPCLRGWTLAMWATSHAPTSAIVPLPHVLICWVGCACCRARCRHDQQQGRDVAELLAGDLSRLAPLINALFFGLVGAAVKLSGGSCPASFKL